MEILTNYNDLVGKKIVFSHMAQFAKQITLATEDGCVLMVTFDFDDYGEGNTIRILYPHLVLSTLNKHEFLRNELGKLGIFDLEKYQEEQRLKKEIEHKAWKEKKEAEEYATYLRLKEKYEKKINA